MSGRYVRTNEAVSYFEHHYSRNVTLGARDISSAVSGFCQVFIVTRAKSFSRLRPTPKIPAARQRNLWYPGYRNVISFQRIRFRSVKFVWATLHPPPPALAHTQTLKSWITLKPFMLWPPDFDFIWKKISRCNLCISTLTLPWQPRFDIYHISFFSIKKGFVSIFTHWLQCYVTPREDKGDRESIPHTHLIP